MNASRVASAILLSVIMSEVMWRLTAMGSSDSPNLTKYVDPLPIPAVMPPVSRGPATASYEIEMTEIKQKLHRDLPETTLWGYNGTYPARTIETRTNEAVRVEWINNLPSKHIYVGE